MPRASTPASADTPRCAACLMGCSTAPRAARKCFPSRPSLVLCNVQYVTGGLARIPESYGSWRDFRFESLHISDFRLQPSKDEGRQVRPDLREPRRTFSRNVSWIVSSSRDLSKAPVVRVFTVPRGKPVRSDISLW